MDGVKTPPSSSAPQLFLIFSALSPISPETAQEADVALYSLQNTKSVDVQAMDDQHGIIMDTVNELRLAVVHGATREETMEIFNRLIHFTRMHFWSEEQLLEKFEFPGFVDHRLEHQQLLSQLQDSAAKMQHSQTMHMRPLMGFLRDSYSEHFGSMDKEYGPWLNARGIF